MSQSGEHALSLSNDEKKNKQTAFVFSHGRRREKKNARPVSHAENKLFIGKGCELFC